MKRISALLLSFALALSACPLAAQQKGRIEPQYVRPDQLDPAEGVKVLEAFRNARTEGDYAFAFQLVNRPRNGAQRTYTGVMLGTWRDGAPLTRTDIDTGDGHTLHLLYKGGSDGVILKSVDKEPAHAVTGDERFQPILDGLTFTPFELQMPFLFWKDYVYEGTRKLMDRPAHYFILYPPENFEIKDVGGVRVVIDANFLVMLSAQILDKDGNPSKDFRINDFKKADGQWIVGEVDLVDKASKDRTRFKVIDARAGIKLPEKVFIKQDDGSLDPALMPKEKSAPNEGGN